MALPEEPTTEARAMCLLGIARNRYLRGLPFDGIEPANHAVAVAERLKNDLVLAKCLKCWADVHGDRGLSGGHDRVDACLASGPQRWDSDQESGIFNNLGLPQYAGQFSMAIPCFERSIEVSDPAATPRLTQALPL